MRVEANRDRLTGIFFVQRFLCLTVFWTRGGNLHPLFRQHKTNRVSAQVSKLRDTTERILKLAALENERLAQQHAADVKVIAALEAEGVLDRERIANLEVALVTARRIGVAMGILMERSRLTDEQAFDELRRVSQRRARKLRDVAEDLVYSGQLPEAG